MPLIEIRKLTKLYRMGDSIVRALDGVDLTIERGEFIAITGASGSGKSTMMHLLGCLDRPTSGVYMLNGRDVATMSDSSLADIRNREIGFVFQTFNLINRTSALDNVGVPLFYARRANTRTPSHRALERVGLGKRSHHKPNELSGGERQRVAIARAIVNDPLLLLADEPTGNLDTRTGEQIMQIFRDLNAHGVTVVLVTHEPDVAMQARRIVQMRDGKILWDRQTAEIQVESGQLIMPSPGVVPVRSAAAPAIAPFHPNSGDSRGGGSGPVNLSPGAPVLTPPVQTQDATRVVPVARVAPTAVAVPDAESELPPAKPLPAAGQAMWFAIVAFVVLVLLMVGQAIVAAVRPELMKPPDTSGPTVKINPEQIVVGLGSLALWLLSLVLGMIALFRGRFALKQIREELGFWTGTRKARVGFWLGLFTVVMPFVMPLIRMAMKFGA